MSDVAVYMIANLVVEDAVAEGGASIPSFVAGSNYLN
jgi:hypothetical protein